MKQLVIILSLVLFLFGCSNESSSKTTPLVEMTRYELDNTEKLKEYDLEYVTYAEIKEDEPVEDWSFDMDKHVLDDNEIIGYSLWFNYLDDELLTLDDFNELLDFVFEKNSVQLETLEECDFMDYESYPNFEVESNDKKFIVYYCTEKINEDGEYGVEMINIHRTF